MSSTKEILLLFLVLFVFLVLFQLIELFILVFLFLNRVSFLGYRFLTLLIVTSIEYKVDSVIIHFSFERGFP